METNWGLVRSKKRAQSQGHSNLFIPSTINGSNFDSNEKLDDTKLKKNLGAVIDVYISAVNGAPCGGKPIHLVKGAEGNLSQKYQERRERLRIFLRGSNQKKAELKENILKNTSILLRCGV